jgi:oligopeptide/dipeptide ABC transporter ATP-binding protein
MTDLTGAAGATLPRLVDGPADLLLEVRGLTVQAGPAVQPLTLVEDLSLQVRGGETLGIVGETGSGKSITAMSICSLLPAGVRVTAGSVHFDGRDLLDADQAELRSVRGSQIGFVFQDPQNSLDPVFTVGDQVTEAIRAHRPMARKDARRRGAELLNRVGIARAEERMADYPHQFSGGMAQRVMLAIALCCDPKLLIADEPTTALDVTTQAQVLELIESVKEERALSVLIVSHDLSVIAEMADRVSVMYAGQIVEEGPTTDLFTGPHHPYLDALIGAQPELSGGAERLPTIAGRVPPVARRPSGCRFHPRCQFADDRCRAGDVPLIPAPAAARSARCVRVAELHLRGISGQAGEPTGTAGQPAPEEGSTATGQRGHPDGESDRAQAPLLEIRGLNKIFTSRRLLRRGRRSVVAVDDVSFDLAPGETLGLVGETGAGKSTIGRLVLGLEHPTAGTIRFRGAELGSVNRRPKDVHRDMQVIFQNPYSSLNPTLTVLDLVAEPIDVHGRLPRAQRAEAVRVLLMSVGLDPAYGRRYIHELSGGQLQRIAIARALSVNPKLIILDEPISSLDVSTQAQVVNLLQDLQAAHELSYLFIGHNLAVVSHISDRLAILFAGQVVETGPSDVVYPNPQHPYTQALIAAVLSPDPRRRRIGGREGRGARVPVAIGASSAVGAPSGEATERCVYAARCPIAQSICWREAPADTRAGSTTVRCHFAGSADDDHRLGGMGTGQYEKDSPDQTGTGTRRSGG